MADVGDGLRFAAGPIQSARRANVGGFALLLVYSSPAHAGDAAQSDLRDFCNRSISPPTGPRARAGKMAGRDRGVVGDRRR